MKALQIDAFQRGDMDALAQAVDASIPEVWRALRRGFVTTENGLETYVRGIDSPDVAERLVVRVLARCCTPDRRKAIGDAEALRRAELEEARAVLLEHANRTGSMVTIADDSARAAIAAETETNEPTIDAGVEQHWGAMSVVAGEALAAMDDRARELVRLRFVEGKSAKETAEAFGCGRAAILSRERRVRHAVKHALRRAFPEEKVGAATIDALLADRRLAPVPPAVTRERIAKDILKRTFQEEPRPYGQRLAWGVGALALASGLWALMFLDVLPYYGDDLLPEPRLEAECNPSCRFRVLAPRDARRVALGIVAEGRPAEVLLASPTGRSIQLPFGARQKAVEIPYTAELPHAFQSEKRAWAVAIFSEDRLNRDQIVALTEGRISVAGVLTTSTALALE